MSNRLYERDFHEWLGEQARLLRAGEVATLDLENLAEEIESVGRSERRELFSRIEVLLTHLLKWQIQFEYRCPSWRGTIREQRRRIEAVLEDSPSLRRQVDTAIARGYPIAKDKAIEETGLLQDCFPTACPYSARQLLDQAFLPG